jgi:polyisoprenoid-binding protein YceI
MKSELFILLIIAASSFNITAQTLQLREGNIRFISEKKGISAENTTFKSEINIQEKTISFSVPITGFSFEKQKMQDHFNNKGVMHSKLFPNASYNGKIISNEDLSKPGSYDVKVEGKIKIKDAEKEYTANGTIKISVEGVAIKSEFMINKKDFNIKGLYANMTDDIIKVFLVSVYK